MPHLTSWRLTITRPVFQIPKHDQFTFLGWRQMVTWKTWYDLSAICDASRTKMVSKNSSLCDHTCHLSIILSMFNVFHDISCLASFDRSKCLAGVCPCTKFSGHSPLPRGIACVWISRIFRCHCISGLQQCLELCFFLLVPNHMTIELLNWEQTIEKMTGSRSGNLWCSFMLILPSLLFCQHVRASAVATKNGGRNYDISLARSLMMEVVSCHSLKNFGWFEEAKYSALLYM